MVNRDFAFILDKEQEVGALIKMIQGVDNKLIKSVKIFDIYAGDKLEEGKKSVALSVEIQASDRTLTDEELQSLSGKIIETVRIKANGELR